MATIRDNHLECGNRHLEMAVESFRLAQGAASLDQPALIRASPPDGHGLR